MCSKADDQEPVAAWLLMVLAPATVKKPQRIIIDKICIQYMPLHWGALTMFIKQKVALQSRNPHNSQIWLNTWMNE